MSSVKGLRDCDVGRILNMWDCFCLILQILIYYINWDVQFWSCRKIFFKIFFSRILQISWTLVKIEDSYQKYLPHFSRPSLSLFLSRQQGISLRIFSSGKFENENFPIEEFLSPLEGSISNNFQPCSYYLHN